jgi:hypothetical protein
MSSLQQNWRKGQKILPGSEKGVGGEGVVGGQGEEMAQTMYAHVNNE